MISSVALLLAIAPVPSAAGAAAGLYLADQMEVAAGLELKADGRFRYALDYGAVSEGAEGSWRLEGTTVRLSSDSAPNDGERSPAVFSNEPVYRDGDLLLLPRYETVIRFKRAQPKDN
jgi:hypothetical protein